MANQVENLLEQMSLEEKVSLLAGTDFWHTRSIPRLGIPAVKVTDGPYGARTMSDADPACTIPATCFPTGVAMAAAWNTRLIERVGAALGEETRDRGCSVLLGPCVNIHRSPLGGRNFESFSEDPYLSSETAVAFVRGVQSRDVGVAVKHFALNNSEYQRFTISSEASERAKREIYFPSFEKVVKEARPWTVMCSYNRLDGTYASQNRTLLRDILKIEWGFEGLVMSDWFATHSAVPAAWAGLDLEMPGPARFFNEALIEAVKNGEVSETVIDDKVRRILNLVIKSGAFTRAPRVSSRPANIAAHRRLAREAACEAIVLLKNDNHILPINANKIKSIAVIGPNASEARIEGGGSSMVRPDYRISPLEGLKKRFGNSVRIAYEPGCLGNRLTPLLQPRYFTENSINLRHGLRAEYFSNPDLAGQPVIFRIERNFSQRWMEASPFSRRLDIASFSARWSGRFMAPLSGQYRWGIMTGEWARIFIDNKLIAGNWGDPSAGGGFDISREVIRECTLEAGCSYEILIEYTRSPQPQSNVRSLRLGCRLPVSPDLVDRAVRLAARSDVALVFAGLNDEWESEGFDRENMDLPPAQTDLICKIAAANPHTVVVLNNGSPLSMSEWIDKVPAVVEAWFPGQECGNAVADILSGDVNPSGKLPDTFPRRIEDNPAYPFYPGSDGKVIYGEDIFVGYRHYDEQGIEPLFPFGHGLSYTTFEYSNPQVNLLPEGPDNRIQISVDVRNSGRRSGREVVQLYLHDNESSLKRPPQELKGFQKVSLRPGEMKTIRFTLDKMAFSFYDPERKEWTAELGDFEVRIGSSSRDIRARKTFFLYV